MADSVDVRAWVRTQMDHHGLESWSLEDADQEGWDADSKTLSLSNSSTPESGLHILAHAMIGSAETTPQWRAVVTALGGDPDAETEAEAPAAETEAEAPAAETEAEAPAAETEATDDAYPIVGECPEGCILRRKRMPSKEVLCQPHKLPVTFSRTAAA